MIGLLPKKYDKIFRTEKISRGLFVVSGVLSLVFVSGLIFLVPSYFILKFTEADILRKANTENVLLQRKDTKSVEDKISTVNSMLARYSVNSAKKKFFSSVFLKLVNAAPQGIKINRIELAENKERLFFVKLTGEADLRQSLISYVENLHGLSEVKELRSPISNLLKNENSPFTLEVDIKSEIYGY